MPNICDSLLTFDADAIANIDEKFNTNPKCLFYVLPIAKPGNNINKLKQEA